VVIVIALAVSLALAELGMRVFPSGPPINTEARFSPRYHHTSPELSRLLRQISAEPSAFRGDRTIVVLGDSFVAGDAIDSSLRFTSVLQLRYDSVPPPRIRIINLGSTSYSTLVYERIYRDVILPLDPDIVIVCLDQTDVADDYLYEQELSSRSDVTRHTLSDSDFTDTILEQYESDPVTFLFLRYSRMFQQANEIKQRWTGSGFMPESARIPIRDAQKLRLYFETCKDPSRYGDLFTNSEKYIRSISLLKPARQKLYFVTYPRAENLTGQHKTTLLHGALPDSHASAPYFEYWIERENVAARYPTSTFIHTSGDFRAAIASTGRQYYQWIDDVHWTADGHRLFAEILDKLIVSNAR